MLHEHIGFIGAGRMSEALIRGFLSAGVSSVGRMSACVRTIERREYLENMGIGNVWMDATEGGAEQLAAASDIIILGVKPQSMPPVLRALAPHVNARHLIISVAAGLRLDTLEAALGSECRVIRAMREY